MQTARHIQIAIENKELSQVDRDGMARYARYLRQDVGAERARYIWRTLYSYAPDLSIR